MVTAGGAWIQFARAVQKGSLLGAASWGYVAVEATVSVFFPDPESYIIGAVTVKTVGWGRNLGGRIFTWGYKNPAKSNLILFVALMPFGIKERQELKAEQGLIEPLGLATFEIERIPDTERLRIPSIPTSRVF